MSGITYGQLICVICQSELLQNNKDAAALTCTGCGLSYPLFAGCIPIMLPDSVPYRVNAFWQYQKHLREARATLAELRKASTSVAAAARASLLDEALSTNGGYIARIQQQLAATLPTALLAQPAERFRPLAYFSSFSYLKRDWCGLPADEQEIQTIMEAVLAGMPAVIGSQAQVLVLGAGTGRVAAMLKDHFQQVYAIDLSLTMACQYHDLVEQGAIRFYDIQSKNARTLAEQAREQWATVGLVPGLEAGSVHYCVADVKQIPLPTNSVSAVVSVYFTDTVPLKDYLPEVKRVLEPGGAFIHFGPLEYHFSDISAHLSVEEVREVFEAHGFRVAQEQEITTNHLFRPESLACKTYHNWSFSAVLADKEKPLNQQVKATSVPLAEYI
ncbi:methyltransferase domain-containing protein [Hymenobacter sp. BT635]|uniref:carnosine N-methyltransferase n=1 Tax=Hymenobacter nitidus TaxID=2880929 RepID=A0ABS8AE04_9BACT|nr:methyltransferase domain-containing protein [Hymenobacter nitidus]MCB2378638.1 methyltransferase domain-containing protein [Hymenobacter nitidus]